jgi:hypothetical protein
MMIRREEAIDAVGWAVLGVMLLSLIGVLLYDRWEVSKFARACRESGGHWVAVGGTEVCVGAER